MPKIMATQGAVEEATFTTAGLGAIGLFRCFGGAVLASTTTPPDTETTRCLVIARKHSWPWESAPACLCRRRGEVTLDPG